MAETLVIVGASARAAAFSARRAGFRPVCGDLFADADLRACCPAVAVTDYPAELEGFARQAPPGPWLYTGGLENAPQLIERIGAVRPLLGVGPAELQRVRDPQLVQKALHAAGLPCPDSSVTSAGLPTDGSWLLKGRGSSGGAQVFPWLGQRSHRANDPNWYFQRRLEGQACAALFAAARGRATLLGVTEQLLAGVNRTDRPFGYAGSLGPLTLSPELSGRFERLGSVLAGEFRLVGLFGVDAVVAENEVWPVEINPRYPASAEIVERATGLPAIALHAAACRDHALPARPPEIVDSGWHGKLILYARQDATISPGLAAEWLQRSRAEWPEIADVPAPGTRIGAGQPVVTLFAKADEREALRRELFAREAYWHARLAEAG